MSVGAWPPVMWVVRVVVGIATGLAGLFGYRKACPHEDRPKAPPPCPAQHKHEHKHSTTPPAPPPLPKNPYGREKDKDR